MSSLESTVTPERFDPPVVCGSSTDRNQRLLFINYSTETFSPAGGGSISTYAYQLCQQAREDGCEITVLTKQHDARPYDWQPTQQVPYPRIPGSGLGLLWHRGRRKFGAWPHLRHRRFAENIADVIAEHGLDQLPAVLHNDPELAVFLRDRFPSMRICCLFHNYHPAKSPFRHRLRSSGVRVAAVSRATGRWVEQYYHLQPDSVITVLNGVNSQVFCPAQEQPRIPLTVNFTGRISVEKAPDILLQAAEQLLDLRERFRLQFLGWHEPQRPDTDPFRRSLEPQVQRLRTSGVEVLRPGQINRDAIVGYLQRASVHVTPSRWEEPCALVNFEAMACGLAVVASNTGGTSEVLGDAGLLFPKDDAKALAQHLRQLITDAGYRQQMSARARRRATSLTWSRTWRTLADVAGIEVEKVPA